MVLYTSLVDGAWPTIIVEAGDYYFSSIGGRRTAVDRLLPTIRAASDLALRDIYVSKVADRTGVRRETLEAEMKRARSVPGSVRVDAPPRAPRQTQRWVPKRGAERILLLLMIKNPDFIERAGEHLGEGDFVDPAYRVIFQALLDDPELRAPPASMDSGAAQRLQEILSDPEELAYAGRVFEESVARIRVTALDRLSQDLDSRIEAAAGDGEKRALTEEKERVSRERRELGPH